MASQSAALSGVGLDVVKLFREVNAINKHVEDGKYAQWPGDLFAAESDRFEVWAVNLGLFVPGHGSLDYRIREASSLRAALLRFMSDLKYSLAEGFITRHEAFVELRLSLTHDPQFLSTATALSTI